MCPKGFERLIDIKKPLNHAGFSGLESDTLILFEGEYRFFVYSWAILVDDLQT